MLSWVNMRPAEGGDYLEFMLYSKLPEPGARGGKNHASLLVPDAQKALKELINLFDPDGTRIELMEPDTADGKPVPSSTAPAPRPPE